MRKFTYTLPVLVAIVLGTSGCSRESDQSFEAQKRPVLYDTALDYTQIAQEHAAHYFDSKFTKFKILLAVEQKKEYRCVDALVDSVRQEMNLFQNVSILDSDSTGIWYKAFLIQDTPTNPPDTLMRHEFRVNWNGFVPCYHDILKKLPPFA